MGLFGYLREKIFGKEDKTTKQDDYNERTIPGTGHTTRKVGNSTVNDYTQSPPRNIKQPVMVKKPVLKKPIPRASAPAPNPTNEYMKGVKVGLEVAEKKHAYDRKLPPPPTDDGLADDTKEEFWDEEMSSIDDLAAETVAKKPAKVAKPEITGTYKGKMQPQKPVPYDPTNPKESIREGTKLSVYQWLTRVQRGINNLTDDVEAKANKLASKVKGYVNKAISKFETEKFKPYQDKVDTLETKYQPLEQKVTDMAVRVDNIKEMIAESLQGETDKSVNEKLLDVTNQLLVDENKSVTQLNDKYSKLEAAVAYKTDLQAIQEDITSRREVEKKNKGEISKLREELKDERTKRYQNDAYWETAMLTEGAFVSKKLTTRLEDKINDDKYWTRVGPSSIKHFEDTKNDVGIDMFMNKGTNEDSYSELKEIKTFGDIHKNFVIGINTKENKKIETIEVNYKRPGNVSFPMCFPVETQSVKMHENKEKPELTTYEKLVKFESFAPLTGYAVAEMRVHYANEGFVLPYSAAPQKVKKPVLKETGSTK